MPVAWSAAVTPALPPDHTKIGSFSAAVRLTSWVRPERIGPDRIGVLRVEDGGEAGLARLDDLLEHDVGLVQTGLRLGVDVVDLDDHRRTRRVRDEVAVDRQAGERLEREFGCLGRRRRRGRRRRGRRCDSRRGRRRRRFRRGGHLRRADRDGDRADQGKRGELAVAGGVRFMDLQLFQQCDPLVERRMRVKQSMDRP